MTEIDQNLLTELLNTFRAEAADHLETINQSLLQLERKPVAKKRQILVQDAFRAAHSLKGAARAVSLEEIEEVANAMESVLQRARDAGMALDANICDVLYDSVDAIGSLLDGRPVAVAPLRTRLGEVLDAGELDGVVEGQQEERDSRSEAITGATHSEETIRVSINKLDELMAQVGELLVSKISAEQRLTEINEINYNIDLWNKTWRELKTILQHVNGDVGAQLSNVLGRHADHMHMLTQAFSTFSQNTNRDAVRLGMVTVDLQDKVRRVRMVPFQVLALGLERTVRDAARSGAATTQLDR